MFEFASLDLIAKIFHVAPEKRLNAECESLRFLGKADVPVSKLVDSGKDLAGCHLLLETKLQGIAANTIYSSLTSREAEEVAFRLGTLLGRVHSIG